MFLIEVLIVDDRPLYCLRTVQGNPVISSFELSEVQSKIADAAHNICEQSKNLKTNSVES